MGKNREKKNIQKIFPSTQRAPKASKKKHSPRKYICENT